MYLLLEETEKQAVRRALIEERGRFCTFITFLQPVVVGPSDIRGIPTVGLVEGSLRIPRNSKNWNLGTTGCEAF